LRALLLCSVGGIRAVLRLRIDLVKVGRGCVVVLCGVGDVDKFFKEPEKVIKKKVITFKSGSILGLSFGWILSPKKLLPCFATGFFFSISFIKVIHSILFQNKLG
jgi:hypothetical protein